VVKTLVALDGSKDSFNALATVCRMALRTGSYITAIYVNKSESYSTEDTGWVSIREKIQKELEARGHEVIRKAVLIAKDHGLQIEGIMAYGLPAEEIANYCASRGIVNLVAMGHSSKRKGTQGFVGSTTRMVMAEVERASFLVTSKAEEITKILIAVDGTEASQKAVTTAGRLAQSIGAEVRLLSVFPDTEALLNEYRQIAEVPNVDRYIRDSEEAQRKRSFLAVESAAQALGQFGLKAAMMVKQGSTPDMIVAESRTANLTVIGLSVKPEQKKIGRTVGRLLDLQDISVLCVQ
jgi:nucleotide-binding universal stress UspA family protein